MFIPTYAFVFKNKFSTDQSSLVIVVSVLSTQDNPL